jgi:hypothetical protein
MNNSPHLCGTLESRPVILLRFHKTSYGFLRLSGASVRCLQVIANPKEGFTMRRASKRSALALLAVMLLAGAGTSVYSQTQTQNQATGSARSRAEETLEWWNQIGNKLIAMAKDFPETSTISKCRKTSAPLRRISCTLPQSITS